MTVGTCTFNLQGVPLNGESEIVQKTAATDILTITGATSQSGDFLVCRNSAGTEVFSINSSGDLDVAGSLLLTNSGTVVPTTANLADGGLYLYSAGGTIRLAVRSGTTIYYFNRDGNL